MPHKRWVYTTRAAAAAGLAAFAAYILLAPPEDAYFTLFNTWVYIGLFVLACVIAASHAYLVERERPAWTVISIAMACWIFGEVWYAAFEPETYPSIADLGYIAFYPLLYVGIVLLLRSRARTIGDMLWLDGTTAALAAGAFGAAVIFELVADVTQGSTSVVVTNLSYPLGDVLLLSAVFGVFSLTGWRPGLRWLLLGLGVLSTALADIVYLFQSAEGTYVEGTWIDILWPAALLLIAASAWVNDRTRAGLHVEGRPLLAVPTVCALIATGILVYDHFVRLNILAIVLATATLALVVVRLAMTFRENRRLFELTHREATTDALTGLGNRRQLLTDLERRLRSDSMRPTLLMLFDLDGFKSYNDTFGHPAGDALLTRLGEKLAAVPGAEGAAYRLGGDEFCLLATVADGEAEPLIDRACAALSEQGEGFEIETSFGAIMLPDEASDASSRAADRRRAALCAEVLAPGRERQDDGGAARSAPGARPGRSGAPRRRRLARSGGRADARAPPRRARGARPSRPAPRPRQARGAGRDPLEARAARRTRVGVRPAAHHRRRADPARVAGAAQHRNRRARLARELGRQRVSRRARRRGHSTRIADHSRLQRIRRHDLAASVSRGDGGRGRARTSSRAAPAPTSTRPSHAFSSPAYATSRKPNEPRSRARAYLPEPGPVAQWIERQTSNLRAEVRLLPGPSRIHAGLRHTRHARPAFGAT